MKKIIAVFLLMVVIFGCFALPGFAADEKEEPVMPSSVNAPEYAYPRQMTGMYTDYMDYHEGEPAQNNVFTTDTLLVLSYVTDQYGMRWVRCQVIDTIYETAGWRGYVREADLRIVQQ